MRTAYLDHAATTAVRADVQRAVGEVLAAPPGNPSGAHALARAQRHRLDEARDAVAELVGRQPGEVVWTSGGTEADDLAVHAAGDRPMVCVATEHHAVLVPVTEAGGRVTPVDATGAVDLDRLAASLDDTVGVVSVMAANNETGRIADLGAVAEVVRDRAPRALLHTDAVQAAAWLDIAALAADVDLLSVSGHKLGAPMGIGALVGRPGVVVRPRIAGGGQERGVRSGTPNVAGAVGFGVAAAGVTAEREETGARVRALRDRLEDELLAAVDGVVPSVARAQRLPGHCHLVIDGVEGEALQVLLDRAGVAASVGASCASGAVPASHVLVAMGYEPRRARGSLRLTLGATSSDADVDHALDVVPPAVAGLRARAGAMT